MKTAYLAGNNIRSTTQWRLIPRSRVGKQLPDLSVYPSDDVAIVITGLGDTTPEEGGSSGGSITLQSWIDYFFPLVLTREQFQLLCWRIRQFRVKFSLSLIGVRGGTLLRSFDDVWEVRKTLEEGESDTYDLATSELHLLLYPTTNYPTSNPAELSPVLGLRNRGFRTANPLWSNAGGANDGEDYEVQEFPGTSDPNDDVQLGLLDSKYPIAILEEDTDEVRVAVSFGIVAEEISDPGPPALFNEAFLSANYPSFLSAAVTPPVPTGSVTVDFGYAGTASFDMYGNEGSFSGSFTPEKWWPYTTGTGLPVYDEDTGDQLRNPIDDSDTPVTSDGNPVVDDDGATTVTA
jgi:hypothetical protein